MRVLVVDDEVLLANAVAEALRAQGHEVGVEYDGVAASRALAETPSADVVVLDRDLPGLHGDEVCRSLLGSGSHVTRVLMLTAASGVEDRVAGLDLGADDYLTKPFAVDELLARVEALGRRAVPATPPVLRYRGLVVDRAQQVAMRDGRFLRLSPKQFGVLDVLVAAAGRVVSAEELLDRAWDDRVDPFTSSVRVTVAGLRRKLGRPPLLETVPGVGYRI